MVSMPTTLLCVHVYSFRRTPGSHRQVFWSVTVHRTHVKYDFGDCSTANCNALVLSSSSSHSCVCLYALCSALLKCQSLFHFVSFFFFLSPSLHFTFESHTHMHRAHSTNINRAKRTACIVLIMVCLLFQFIQFFSLQNDYFNNNFALVVTFSSSFFSTRATLRSNIWDATNEFRKKRTHKTQTNHTKRETQTAQLVRNWCQQIWSVVPRTRALTLSHHEYLLSFLFTNSTKGCCDAIPTPDNVQQL